MRSFLHFWQPGDRPAAGTAALAFLVFLLLGCTPLAPRTASPGIAQQPLATAPPTLASEVLPVVETAAPSPATATPAQTPAPAETPTTLPTRELSPSPTPTPDPYKAITIEGLAARTYGGGELQIVETLERNEHFARYLIHYPSDGLDIAGFMNVPHEGSRFPVAIVLHGYIPPAEYETLAYTQRYADALAEAGYFVIHPNLRNYPPSDSGANIFRTGMAIDVLNLIAIIREQSQDPLGTLRRANGEDIHLWGHSMGGGVALRVVTVNNDPAIKTAVLYGAMSGDEIANFEIIQELSGGRRGGEELAVSEETLRAISPINYLERIQAAISIHHSDADDVVPVEWSEDLCRRLQAIDHPVECFTYQGAPHTFNSVWDEVFIDRFTRFFDRH